MPTGYTSSIYDGENVSVKEYISTCARAFGAYVLVRDEPLNKKVPDEFLPSPYHKKQLEKAKTDLEKFSAMTLEEAELIIGEEHKKEVERKSNVYTKQLDLSNRYKKMLEEVREWQPPTKEHSTLKAFCVKQLVDSLNYDCTSLEKIFNETVKPTPEEWLHKRVNSCLADIEYHLKKWEEEIEQTNKRNLWIKQLNDSLDELNKR
ncbi:hypothetical protein P4V47_16630 [Brevibacillus laterosporus]|uniref:hypothetical protein n=1 Tax=Brevibacillus laterosporus TaxID=1465 RepID=UPI002E1DA901|nr:hypothetical protein [Brevibacillus laterosporus]